MKKYELSIAQKSIMSMEESFPNDSYNNIGALFFYKKKVEIKKLQEFFNYLLKNNDAFRIRIGYENGKFYQYKGEYKERKFEVLNFENDREGYEKWHEEHVKEKIFNLDEELFRIKFVIRYDGILASSMLLHHLISDAYSIVSITHNQIMKYIFLGELTENNNSYFDHIKDEKEYLNNSRRFVKGTFYWNEKFKNFSGENIYAGQISADLQGDILTKDIGVELTKKIYDFCYNNNVTPYNLFMTAVIFYLYKITMNEDVVLGTPLLNRKNKLEKNTTGMFVNTIPLVINVDNSFTVKDLLAKVKKEIFNIFTYQQYPYEKIQESFFRARGYSMDLLEIIFSYQNAQFTDTVDSSYYDSEWVPNKRCSNPLSIHVFDHNRQSGFKLRYDYQIRKISKEEIERIHERIITIIEEFIRNPDSMLSSISCLSNNEKELVINVFNNNVVTYEKDLCIHELIKKVVDCHLNKKAIIFYDKYITYKELDEKSNSIANYLLNKGINKEEVIAIAGEKQIESIIAILGILKAGGAYVPINSRLSNVKQEYIINDSKTRFILSTDIDKVSKLNVKNVEIVDLMNPKLYLNIEKVKNVESNINDLAYIIYTSGTTGNPKGVMVEHRSVSNLVPMCKSGYGMNENDIVLQFANLAFDQAVWDIIGTLLIGATICLVDQDILSKMSDFEDYLNLHNVTVAALTPALLRNLEPKRFKTLRIIESGGEAANLQVLRNWSEKVNVFNAYGPTEATVNTTLWKYDNSLEKVLIGKPLPNVKVYVMNEGSLCGIGMKGELCIAGDGLARGYLGKEDLTNKVFINNSGEVNERIYRSGDYVKWTENGELEYLGRKDDQVKIRGFRIELSEIESTIKKQEGIKEAAVLVFKEEENYLVAYYELKDGYNISNKELRDILTELLPDYMVPSVYIYIENMPMTPNGKIDKRMLPKVNKKDFIQEKYVAPRNDLEKELVFIFEEVLGVERVGIEDNFFDLGGHSLKAIKLINKIDEKIGIRLNIRLIFENPTIEKMALIIEKGSDYKPLPKAAIKDYYEMSSTQKRIYLLNDIAGDSTSYNMPASIEIKGKLDKEKIENTFKKIIERHEALRTTFHVIDGNLVQKIEKNIDFKVEYIETELMNEKIIRDFIRPFDLSKGPLLRISVVEDKSNGMTMLFDMHHIISDGESVNIIINEFNKIYNEQELDNNVVQYKDYSEWMKSRDLSNLKEYWKSQFADEIPILNLSYDFNRPQIQSFNGNRITEFVDKDIKRGIIELSKKTKTTEYMVLLSSLMVLLSKYSRQEDIIIGTPVSGRIHKDVENVIGMFVNTIPFRGKPNKEKTFEQFLEEIKNTCIKGYENQEYPFEQIIEDINFSRDLSRNPLFDIMFSFENNEEIDLAVDNIEFKISEFDDKLSKFDISFDFKNNKNGYTISLQYCTDLFNENTINNMIKHYKKVLLEIVNNSEKLIKDIDIVTEDERNLITNEFNNTDCYFEKEKTISELFQKQVETYKDKIAVIYEDQEINYNKLNIKANIIANKLRKLGVKPNEFVAIVSEKSIEAIEAILGVIKSGAAYVPIDPNYPQERKDYILNDCKPKVILSYKSGGLDYNIPVINLEEKETFIGDSSNPKIINKANDLAYVIYTSGTTGKPKGVMLEEKGLHNVIKAYEKIYGMSKNDVVLQFASISFDQSVWDIFAPLLIGATLCMIPSDLFGEKDKFVEYLNNKNVTVAALTPAFINELEPEKFITLRAIESGGAVAKKEVLDKWVNYIDVYNTYGPTETTINAITYKYEKNDKLISIPIGKPIDNIKVYVMNNEELCGIGIPGELCITGVGLARGYLNREDLTNEKFINNPYGEGKLYKTGDLVRWLPDGNIQYLGRIDEQVKIRGFRIELGEIENVILKIDKIKDAIVTIKEKDGSSALYGYYVSNNKVSVSELICYLKKELPEYMVPQYWMELDNLPLNKNGKVDKKLLPDIEIERHKEYIAPTNEKESVLVNIMSDILGVEKIGINDSFFELGGDSIKAIRIVSKIREAGYLLTVKELLKAYNMEEIAKRMKKDEEALRYEQNDVVGFSELTPIQRDFFQEKLPEENYYNQALVFKSNVVIEEEILKYALTAVIKHHDILRSVFEGKTQKILSSDKSKLFDINIYRLETSDFEEEIRVKSEYIQSSIDLVNGPLVKVGLFKGNDNDYLMICIHHLVIDGVSWRILLEDLQLAYKMAKENKEIKLPLKTASYKQWAEALIEYSKTNVIAKQIDYWNYINNNIEKVDNVFNRNLEEETFELENTMTNKLLFEAEKAYSTDVQEILLISLAMAINKLTSKSKIAILLEGHGREEIHKPISIDRTIGWFTSKYPIIINIFDSIEQNIINTKEMIRKIPNNGIGYGVIKHYLDNETKYIEPDICFNYLGQIDNEINDEDMLQMTNISAGKDSSINNKEPYVLSFNGGITEGKLRLNISYDINVYNINDIGNLKKYLYEELRKIIDFCCLKEETVKTASDFDDDLTNDVLDELMDIFE